MELASATVLNTLADYVDVSVCWEKTGVPNDDRGVMDAGFD